MAVPSPGFKSISNLVCDSQIRLYCIYKLTNVYYIYICMSIYINISQLNHQTFQLQCLKVERQSHKSQVPFIVPPMTGQMNSDQSQHCGHVYV